MKVLQLIFLCFGIYSCSPDLPDGDQLIKDIYEIRVLEYVSQKENDCKAEAIAAAEEHVDSIVHRMLNADLVDSLKFPTRPVKPFRPQSIIGKVDKFIIEEEM